MPIDHAPLTRVRMLSDAELDLEIAAVGRLLDSLAGNFESMLAERERRGGGLQAALTSQAYGYLDAHRDVAAGAMVN